MATNKLTDKQASFVSEYLIDLNATQAAIRAKYSEKTAQQVGSENLSKPVIQEAIRSAQIEAQDRNKVTVDEITRHHRRAIDLADESSQPSAMTTAANNLAKLHGLIIDHSQISGKDGAPIEIATTITFNGKSKDD